MNIVNSANVNTFLKGDVFSLGLTFLYASSLKRIQGLNRNRE